MLRHTQKMKKLYEEIQKKIYYMIPDKWDKVYVYASIIDRLGKVQTGELFFYYIPKGILKKNPINGYEIPSRFNIDESDYLKLVDSLYEKIKELRQEFINSEQRLWSNVTISIEDIHFKMEYNYDDLQNSDYDSYERHIIWRYKYLGYGFEHANKEEREILKRYFEMPDKTENEIYETGIYIKNVKNIIGYDTEEQEEERKQEPKKNQILSFKPPTYRADTYIVNRKHRDD